MLYFDVTGEIPVRLITTRKPEPDCYPGDDGRDTSYKKFVLVEPVLANAPIFGLYTGHDLDNPTNEYTIDIRPPWPVWAETGIYGLPDACPSTSPSPIQVGYKYIAILDDAINCYEVQGIGNLSDDHKTITINYSRTPTMQTKDRVNRTFVGVKK